MLKKQNFDLKNAAPQVPCHPALQLSKTEVFCIDRHKFSFSLSADTNGNRQKPYFLD